MKISDAEKVNRMEPLDMLPIVTENGFRSIFAEDLAKSVFLVMANEDDDSENADLAREIYFEFLDSFADVEIRRNTFRGKLLGTEVTDEQYAHIADGSFKGFFCGDYWRINGHTWRIADFDYWLEKGNNTCTTHHISMFPDESLFSSSLRDTNTTEGGILATKYFSTNEIDRPLHTKVYEDYLCPAFGASHILNFMEYVSNTVQNGNIKSGVWTLVKSMLPSEPMIFGSRNCSSMSSDNVISINADLASMQLALLRLNPSFVSFNHDEIYWERDVVDVVNFCCVGGAGTPWTASASNISVWIRPVFGLK